MLFIINKIKAAKVYKRDNKYCIKQIKYDKIKMSKNT